MAIARVGARSSAPYGTSPNTGVADAAELVARFPVRHRRCLCRFPSQPKAELRHLRGFGPVPLRIEFVARLVVVLGPVLLGGLVAPRFSLADDVVAGIDAE